MVSRTPSSQFTPAQGAATEAANPAANAGPGAVTPQTPAVKVNLVVERERIADYGINAVYGKIPLSEFGSLLQEVVYPDLVLEQVKEALMAVLGKHLSPAKKSEYSRYRDGFGVHRDKFS